MPADDRRPFEPVVGTHHARPAGSPARARPCNPRPRRTGDGPRPAPADRHRHRHRRRGPAGDLAIHQSRLPQFYVLTMGLAGTWAAGALSSGPLLLNMTQGREDARRHPVVMPVLTGAAAFGLFYGAAQLARHIPPLNRAIGSVLRYADDGSTPLVLLTACANAVAEELFFRGALWSLVQDSHPLATDHPRLRRHHRRDPQPRARARRNRHQRPLRPPAPHLRRHPGPGAHPPHMVAPHAALPPAPVSDAPPGRDHPGLTARAAWQMAADSAPATHRTRRSARGSPWILLSFQPRRFGVIWVIEDHRALRAI